MDYDIVIIGAGVVGLAVARELAESSDKTVLVIEKEANLRVGETCHCWIGNDN